MRETGRRWFPSAHDRARRFEPWRAGALRPTHSMRSGGMGRISESLTIGAVGARRLRRAGEQGSEGRA